MSLTHEYHEIVEFVTHMNHNEETIKELHATYCRMSGMDDLPLTLNRMSHWEAYCNLGYTQDDLRLVIEMLRRKIKTGPNTMSCLRFNNLIVDIERFQEELSLARAKAREPKREPDKESVLKATGRPTHYDKPTRTAAQVLADQEALKKFREFKETL